MINTASLDTILATWKKWGLHTLSMPVVVSKADAGLTNQTYFLSSQADKSIEFTLRIFSEKTSLFRINRPQEYLIQSAIAEINLAPRVIYYDETLGFSICEYVQGNTISEEEFKTQKRQAQLSQAIERYQQIELDIPRFNYYEHVTFYANQVWNALSTKEQSQWKSFSINLQTWQKSNWREKLTHHDLSHHNVLFRENSVSIIDWEYAGLGHELFDKISLSLKDDYVASKQDIHILNELSRWLNLLWFKI